MLAIPVLIKLLLQWKLFDSPGDHKIHGVFKPSMGGVAIMLGVVFTLIIALPFSEWVELKYFFVALAVMFITGLRDDILVLTPMGKLVGQLLPIAILVVFGKTVLNSFYDLNPSVWPTAVSWGISVFTLVILTNAYNLIDGLDGLAGSVALVIFAFFGVWFYGVNDVHMATLALAFAGSIMAFLFFNWQPSKLFMGDTGTLSIGFVLAFLAITAINQNYSLPSGHPLHFSASISTALCILIVPVFDTVRVILLRLQKLQSPFKADRNHLHHQFIRLGFTHSQTTVFIVGINLIFIAMAWILRKQSDVVILPVVAGICFCIHWLLKIAVKKHTYVGQENTGA